MFPPPIPAPADPPSDAVTLAHVALHDPDFRRAHAAARRMREAGIDQAAGVQALAEGLRHPDPLVRRRAAQALSQVGPAAVLVADGLRDGLRDPMWTVREAVVEALAALPFDCSAARADLLGCALQDRSPLVRDLAGRAAVRLGLVAPLTLESALGHPYPKVRRRAVELLGCCPPGTPGLAAALRSALEDGHARVRLAAAGALDATRSAVVEDLPRLVRCVIGADDRMRPIAEALVLRVLSDPAAVGLRWLTERTPIRDPEELLRTGLERPDLPRAVKGEFIAVCGRRRKWHQLRSRSALGSDAPPNASSTWEAVQLLVTDVRDEARHGEFAWLLGLLCELWLKTP